MTQRFSPKELFEMRNNISIDLLIKSILRIPSKISEGYLRFACPLCNEFMTATNPQTNLARCFRCERNFNTIDMVMIENKIGFVDSVRFLKKYNQSPSVENRNNEPKKGGQPNAVLSNRRMAQACKHGRSKNTPGLANTADCEQPVAIGQVMKKILPNLIEDNCACDLKPSKNSSFEPNTRHMGQEDLIQLIQGLEQQIRYLSAQLEKIRAITGL
jgi:hypothetical protein